MKFVKRKDIVFIILTLIMCIFAINIYRVKSKEGVVTAQIFYDNKIVKEIDLSSKNPQEIVIAQAKDVVITYDGHGNIFFKTSSCPDKICINAGKLSNPLQTAACIPNKVIIKIVSKKDIKDAVDGVS